eukprot:g10042.t1
MAASTGRICDAGSEEGWIFPLFESELDLPKPLIAVIYFLYLGYLFLGIAVGSDVFMGGVEAITSMKRTVRLKTGELATVEVWNETVATLSLLALGSSAPEILLAAVELVQRDFFSGELGAGTIVGSAGFNLFLIIGVCILAIPNNESRGIRDFPVFQVCTMFMLFAYLWVVVCLGAWTPGEVSLAEGIFTLLLFPVLVLVAVDAHQLALRVVDYHVKNPHVSEENLLRLMEQQMLKALLEQEYNSNGGKLSAHGKVRARRIARKVGKNTWYSYTVLGRFSRALQNAGNLILRANFAEEQIVRAVSTRKSERCGGLSYGAGGGGMLMKNANSVRKTRIHNASTQVSFVTANYTVIEHMGEVVLQLQRTTNAAGSNPDYEFTEATVIFEPGEVEKLISVRILDDDAPEEDETFFVDLISGENLSDPDALLAEPEIIARTTLQKTEAVVLLERRCGITGKIACHWRTVGGTARAHAEYVAVEAGRVELQHGECSAKIVVELPPALEQLPRSSRATRAPGDDTEGNEDLPDHPPRIDEDDEKKKKNKMRITSGSGAQEVLPRPGRHLLLQHPDVVATGADSSTTKEKEKQDDAADEEPRFFFVEVFNPEGFNSFLSCNNCDGASASTSRARVTLKRDESVEEYLDGVSESLQEIQARLDIDEDSEKPWLRAVRDCLIPGEDDTFLLFGVMAPWKLYFTLFVPPATLGHGVPTFVLSLALMGLVVACVNDVALMIGCALDISDMLTALTLRGVSMSEMSKAQGGGAHFSVPRVENSWDFSAVHALRLVFADTDRVIRCALDISDMLTALTLVAAGTSLPDTFASKIAAEQNEDADESITNVTGSNSVNVFLGLGIPWFAGSLFWRVQGPTAEWRAHCLRVFALNGASSGISSYSFGSGAASCLTTDRAVFLVPTGNVNVGALTFLLCACGCIGLLLYRRRCCGGELGGADARVKYLHVAFLVALWLVVVLVVAFT